MVGDHLLSYLGDTLSNFTVEAISNCMEFPPVDKKVKYFNIGDRIFKSV